MDVPEALGRLWKMGDPEAIRGRARFGIPETDAYGASLLKLRRVAKGLARDAQLADGLWRSGVHEGKSLATLVMPPDAFTRTHAERWLKDVVSWDVCDGLALDLVDKCGWAYDGVAKWVARPDEWGKRSGFATMAGLARHDKEATDTRFHPFFALIEQHGADDRGYVKKAVSRAFQRLGERSPGLHCKALVTATKLEASSSKGARWAGKDALKELRKRAP